MKLLCEVPTDTIRVHAITCVYHIASNLSKKANQSNHLKVEVDEILYPLLMKLMTDQSWKVRFSVCQNLEHVQKFDADPEDVL